MNEGIECVQVVVLHAQAKITLAIYVYCDGIPVSYNDPLPDVELLTIDEKWIFDVLLRHPMRRCPTDAHTHVLEHIIYLIGADDAPPAALAGRLDDPRVGHSVYFELLVARFNFTQNLARTGQDGARRLGSKFA